MKKPVFGFIDASNLFYGGVELDGFPYSILDKEPINLIKLINTLNKKMTIILNLLPELNSI